MSDQEYALDPYYDDFLAMLRLRFPERCPCPIADLWEVFKDGAAAGYNACITDRDR